MLDNITSNKVIPNGINGGVHAQTTVLSALAASQLRRRTCSYIIEAAKKRGESLDHVLFYGLQVWKHYSCDIAK